MHKIILLGDSGVGKTSLVRRFVRQEFQPVYTATFGVAIEQVTPGWSKDPKLGTTALAVWDIEGSTEPSPRTETYMRGAAGAILVADATRPRTRNGLIEHGEFFAGIEPAAAMLVVENKCDIAPPDPDALREIADDLGAGVLQTSAKTGEGVIAAFEALVAEVLGLGRPPVGGGA
ncbi:MAG: Rab family GTPase [Pseudomonadota bacterium]